MLGIRAAADEDSLLNLVDALPEAFPFYHLGMVQAQPLDRPDHEKLFESFDDSLGVAFSLSGDIRGLIVLVFDKGLDLSTYAEMGNIIASRLADNLSARSDGDVLISPPKTLEPAQILALIQASPVIQVRSYRHVDGERTIPLHALIMSATTPEGRKLPNV